MSNTTDERLIEAIRKNDYVSYNKLFERYYGRLCQYGYCARAFSEYMEEPGKD